jgi:hypothetical protein
MRRPARLAGALAFAALLAACSAVNDPAGFTIVAQDKYDFMTCKEIIDNRDAQTGRMKALADLMEKADTGPGGFLISAAAYRSEYVQTRARLAAADRAARLNGCDAAKKQ